MSYDTRLREARKRAGLTQEELGKIVGCAKTTITGYETGKSEPNMTVLSKIMEALKVDANFIFQDEMREHYEYHATSEEMETLVKKYRLVNSSWKDAILNILDLALAATNKKSSLTVASPSNQNIPAKNFDNCIDFRTSYQPASAGTGVYLGPDGFVEKRVRADQVAGADFGVPVRGDSMEPKYHDGDILLISMSQPAEVGDIALVTMDGCGYVKKIGHGELISLNRQYKPIPMTEDIRINGKVIGVLPAEQ